MAWTDERVARLTKLWADGLSASQVAADLGGVTRNAVIGKVHRLGLSGRVKQPSKAGGRPKRAPRANGYTRTNNRAAPKVSRTNTASAAARPAREELNPPKPKRLKLIQLTESTCKWPIGDPQHEDFCFCGHSIKADTPYCEFHCNLAYQPLADRRRVRKPNVQIR